MSVEIEHGHTAVMVASGAEVSFGFNFQSASISEIEVRVDGEIASPADYTVTRFDDGTGSVQFVPPLAAGRAVQIFSKPTFRQEVKFHRYGAFFPDHFNAPLDRAALRDIYLKGQVSRALMVRRGQTALPVADLAGQNGKVLAVVDGRIDAIENTPAEAADHAAAAEAARAASVIVRGEVEGLRDTVSGLAVEAGDAAVRSLDEANRAQLEADRATSASLTAGYYHEARDAVPAGIADGSYWLTNHATDAGALSLYRNVGGVVTLVVEKFDPFNATLMRALRDEAIETTAALSPDAANNVQMPGAGNAVLTGSDNTAIGAEASLYIGGGAKNVSVGRAAGRGNVNGEGSVNIGADAGLLSAGGDNNVRIGRNAQANVSAATSLNVAIGAYALNNYAGNEAVAVGYGAGSVVTTAVRYTAIGTGAGGNVNNDGCTFIGWGAGGDIRQTTIHTNMTAIGQDSYCDFENQVALGDDQVRELRFAGSSYLRAHAFGTVMIGPGAGNRSTERGAGVIIGFEAGAAATSVYDERQVIIGYLACNQATANRAWVAIGDKAGEYAQNTVDCTVAGSQAGRWLGRHQPLAYEAAFDETHIKAAGADVTQGKPLPPNIVGATFFGKNAGRYNTIGHNNTGFGDSALGYTTTGSFNVAVGYISGEGNVTGSRNAWLGQGIRVYQYSGDDNAQVGFDIGNGLGGFDDWVAGGSRNSNLGSQAVWRWQGSDTASLGYRTLYAMTGGTGGDVAIGYQAGISVVTGGDNIFIGKSAGQPGTQATNVQNSIAIGAGTSTAKNNQVVIGNASNDEFVLGGVVVTKAKLIALLALVA